MTFSAVSEVCPRVVSVASIYIYFWVHASHFRVVRALCCIYWVHSDWALTAFVCVDTWSCHLIITSINFYWLHFWYIKRIRILGCLLGNNSEAIIWCICCWPTRCFRSSFLKGLNWRSRQRFWVLFLRRNIREIAAF